MTVRSRCPAGLLRRPVRSVKLQGTSFLEGARGLRAGRTADGGRILLSREQCRSEASPLGWASHPSYSERNRSHTVLRGADRRHPVGGPAARAALSSPVGPSPMKSREPWLVLSPSDRWSRTRPATRAQTPETTAAARTSLQPTVTPMYRVACPPAGRPMARPTPRPTSRAAYRPTSTGASVGARGLMTVSTSTPASGLAASGSATPLPSEPTNRLAPQASLVPPIASRAPRRPARSRALPGASCAPCTAWSDGAAEPGTTVQGLASGVAGTRPTPQGLR